MKKYIYLLSAFGALVVLFFAFAPEDRILLVKTKYRRLLQDPGQLCLDYHAIALKDPKTAEILEVSKASNYLAVVYRAKNGFGAYSTDKFVCQLTKGEFTEFDQLLTSVSSRLHAGIEVSQKDFDILKKDTNSLPPSDLKEILDLERNFYHLIR